MTGLDETGQYELDAHPPESRRILQTFRKINVRSHVLLWGPAYQSLDVILDLKFGSRLFMFKFYVS